MKTFLFVTALAWCVVARSSAQLTGSVSSNPAGGQDANIAAVQRFGTPDANIGGGVFASGNTQRGPATTGAFLDANKNGHGISLQHSNTPGFGSTFSQNGHVNLLNDNVNKLDATAFHSRTHLDNGFKFDKFGGGLNYNHDNGHGASLSASRIPQLNMNSVDLTGRANLWRSDNRQTALDLTGTASRQFGGGQPPRNNFGAGLGLTHWFG